MEKKKKKGKLPRGGKGHGCVLPVESLRFLDCNLKFDTRSLIFFKEPTKLQWWQMILYFPVDEQTLQLQNCNINFKNDICIPQSDGILDLKQS